MSAVAWVPIARPRAWRRSRPRATAGGGGRVTPRFLRMCAVVGVGAALGAGVALGAQSDPVHGAGDGTWQRGTVSALIPVAAESSVVVRAGDTLWSIASRTFPGADPREAVMAFRRVNGGDLSVLEAGQRLAVPSRL